MRSIKQQTTPVTVVAGFLGAGKTTLLNHLLNNTSGIRYAVMVNDFGDIAIDNALINEHDGDTISFANGCVCCSLGDNLLSNIDKLLEREPPLDQFIVEASGVANPKVIADVATLHPKLHRDLIISVVDAETLQQRLDDTRLTTTIKMQLSPADLILLNKCDIADDTTQTKATAWLQEHYSAEIIPTRHAVLHSDVLSAIPLQHNNDTAEYPHNPDELFCKTTVPLSESIPASDVISVLQQNKANLVRAKGFARNDDNSVECIQLSGNRVTHYTLPSNTTVDTIMVLLSLDSVEPMAQQLSKLADRDGTQPQCYDHLSQ